LGLGLGHGGGGKRRVLYKGKQKKKQKHPFFKSRVYVQIQQPQQPLAEEGASPATSSAKIKIEIGRRPF